MSASGPEPVTECGPVSATPAAIAVIERLRGVHGPLAEGFSLEGLHGVHFVTLQED